MLLIRNPWESQPQESVPPDQRWIARGLVYADDGRGTYWTPATGVVPATAQAGRPKATAGVYGISQGFGSTYGSGTTDTLVTGTIPRSALARSYVSFQFANGGGGGGGGRIAENSAETFTEGLAGQNGTAVHYTVKTSSTQGQYSVANTITTGAWTCVGISHNKSSTGILPLGYANGAPATVTTSLSASGSYTTTPYTLTRGNRTSDNARNWDGLLGPLYIFESFLFEAEHLELARNPWALFAPRSIWVPVSAAGGGGTSVTGILGTAAASGFAATIGANRLVSGALGTASAVGFTATISTTSPRTVTGVLGTAVASGFAATIGANRLVAGALGTATATGYTATVSNTNDRTVSGVLGTATASGFTATIAFNRFIAGVLGTADATGYTATISTTSPTIGRPASDTSNSGWTASTGSDLYAMLDEVTPDSADYIVTTSTGSICEMPLQTTAYPGTSAQKLSYRASSSTGNSVIVRLKNTGGATVRTETQVLTATDTLYEITLTAGERAAITSGALSVQLESA